MGPDMLKTAQHPMSWPKTGLDAEKLFAKGPGGIGSDLRTFRPSFFTISLNSLVGSARVARKEVCLGRKQRSQKLEVGSISNCQLKERKRRKLTINHVFNPAKAGSQQRLLIGPSGAFRLELGKKTRLFHLRLLPDLLEKLRLLRQLLDQSVTLLSQLVALCLLVAQRGVGLTQLLL